MRRKLTPIVAACICLVGCQTTGPQQGGGWTSLPAFLEQPAAVELAGTPASNPCADAERQKEAMAKSVGGAVIGAIGGAVVGALLDHMAGNKNGQLTKLGALAGMAAGAVKGYNTGLDVYRRQCALFKNAQAKNAPIEVVTVKEAEKIIGEVFMTPARGFFVQGTDELTPAGIEYFTAQAREYTTEVQMAGYEQTVREAAQKDHRIGGLANYRADAGQRAEVSSKWQKMTIMLTGHVDDRYSGPDPVGLSERRAKNVADIFRSVGVPASSLIYQGAGSSLPIGDNNIESGRERNNRVEIAVFYDERTLTPYQEARRPDHRLFTKSAAAVTSAPSSTPTAAAQRPSTSAANTPPAVVTSVASGQVPLASGIEFGGKPISDGVPNAAEAIGAIQPASTSLLTVFGIGNAIASNNLAAPNCLVDDANRYSKSSAKRLSDSQELGGRAPISLKESYLNVVKRSYSGGMGDHYVELKNLTISKNGQLADQPMFNVFKSFQQKNEADRQKTKAPDIALQPVAFAIRGEKGVLVRQFFDGKDGLVCMDVVLPNDQQRISVTERTSLIYTANGVRKVANAPLKF